MPRSGGLRLVRAFPIRPVAPMLSERLLGVVNDKARATHGHFLEISITVAIDNPLMPSKRTASLLLRCVGIPHIEQAALGLACVGAPSGAIQYRALSSKSIWFCSTPGTTGRRRIYEFGNNQRIAWRTFTDEKSGHTIP